LIVLKLIAVVSLFMLTACVTTKSEIETRLTQKSEVITPTKEQFVPDRKTAIDSGDLFLLMTAEIAGQRGQYALALDGYLRAAKRVKDIAVIKRAAQIALYINDDTRLQDALSLWKEVDPGSLEMHYLMLFAAIKSKDERYAMDSIDYILAQDTDNFDTKMIGMLKGTQKKAQLNFAYQILEQEIKKYPQHAQLLFVQAYIDMQLNRRKNAQIKISQVLALNPHWVKALLLQAQLFIGQNDYAQATEMLKQADVEENSIQLKEQIVQLLIQQKKFDEAKTILQKLIVTVSKNKELKFKLALVYLQIGEEGKARVILETLINEKQYHDRSAFYLGRIEAKAKHTNEALIWFDAVRGLPYEFDARISSILILMDKGRFDDALFRIKQLKSDFPEKISEIILIESEIYSEEKKYQQAFDVLTDALLNDAENKKILYTRALVAEKLGKFDVLEDDLKYILQKTPNDANVLNALGYTLADKTTRYAEAKDYLDKAIAIKSNEPVILDSYGWLLFKMKHYHEAEDYLQRAYKLMPQAEIAAHLVEVLWAIQQKEAARLIYKKAIARYPHDLLLLDVKQRLLDTEK